MGIGGQFRLSRSTRIVTVAEKPSNLTIKEVEVRAVYPSRLIYAGHVSGKEYIWSEGGAIVKVLEEDVPFLLEKRIGSKSCCGAVNTDGNKVFELA